MDISCCNCKNRNSCDKWKMTYCKGNHLLLWERGQENAKKQEATK